MTSKHTENMDLIIFGGTGDLSLRKLMPALYYMYRDGGISDNMRITAVARSDLNHQDLLDLVYKGLQDHLPNGAFDEAIWNKFKPLLNFMKMDLNNSKDWQKLSDMIQQHDDRHLLYYMAVPPTLFGVICEHIKDFNLNPNHSRIIVEKPLGEDLKTAHVINDLIADAFSEQQTYRIDHYLGKTAVQNLLDFRFSNPDFKKIWHKDYIENIQITVAETVGVEGRFEFLDRAGVLRDMVQNHLMQILTLMTMPEPKSMQADDIRDEKTKMVKALRPITQDNLKNTVIRGQYGSGHIKNNAVPAYLEEIKGKATGTGETFIAIAAHIDNDIWQDVPFYLRMGKRLEKREINVTINFKSSVKDISQDIPSRITLQIQPDIFINPNDFATKTFSDICPLNPNKLHVSKTHDGRMADAYEMLLIDIIKSDQSYFVRRDEIEASWAWIDTIRTAWANTNAPMETYKAGSMGSDNIDYILQDNHHKWFN